MSSFEEIAVIFDRLLSDDGCPWDKEQTMKSIRSAPIEEGCELKEAIESEDNFLIQEELGDLFLSAIFLAKLAEKEKRFSISEMFQMLSDKLIRRHPHVFGEAQVKDSHAVKEQWESIKKKEKGKEMRQSVLDSLPKGLFAVHRAQKVISKMRKAGYTPNQEVNPPKPYQEEALADALFSLMIQAEQEHVDLEHALSLKLQKEEDAFRAFEKNAL